MESRPAEVYQPGGRAWSPCRADIIQLLRSAPQRAIQPIYYGSNHTFLVTLDGADHGESFAVYKPARGEYPLYDFPAGTLYRREVGAWLVDAILGWRTVPPTVVADGLYGIGSVQLFIDALDSAEVEVRELRRIALLDALINNADRKMEHCLPGRDGRLWAIDHGLSFHAQPKLRTALWHFAGAALSRREERDVQRLARVLKGRSDPCASELAGLLSRQEWRALEERVRSIAESGKIPNPRYKPVPYRW